jgi:16S rRNA (guanine527-N7)-methyltransferase
MDDRAVGSLTDFERGFLAGLVIGEGHFGIHRGRAHFVLGMNVRHEFLMRRVQDLLPGSILYGSYHWEGRNFLSPHGPRRGLAVAARHLRFPRDGAMVPTRRSPVSLDATGRCHDGCAGAAPPAVIRFMIYGAPQGPHSYAEFLRSDSVRALVGALSDSTAPTSVHEIDEVENVHIADSLAGLEVPAVRDAARIADIGSGAGLPGLVLAIARPEAEVVLVESVGKKCAWLKRTVERLGLENVRVACARLEELDEASFDVVTARALAALPVLCEYAAPLLREGGALVAWKGAVDAREEADGLHAAGLLGLAREEVRGVEPYPGSERRTLHVFRKVGPTPTGYPRRPGMAAKRPLTAPGIRPAR